MELNLKKKKNQCHFSSSTKQKNPENFFLWNVSGRCFIGCNQKLLKVQRVVSICICHQKQSMHN